MPSEHDVMVYSYGQNWHLECADCPDYSRQMFPLDRWAEAIDAADQHRMAAAGYGDPQ